MYHMQTLIVFCWWPFYFPSWVFRNLTLSTFYLCCLKIIVYMEKAHSSSGLHLWWGQHPPKYAHFVFAAWFPLGSELVKPYPSGFRHWVGSVNSLLAIFTWAAWGESCKLLSELRAPLTNCWELRKCAPVHGSIWTLTHWVHLVLWRIRSREEVAVGWVGLHLLVWETRFWSMQFCVHVCTHSHECVTVTIWLWNVLHSLMCLNIRFSGRGCGTCRR